MAVLNIDVKTNGISQAKAEIKNLDTQLNNTSKSTKSLNTGTNGLNSTLAKGAGVIGGAVTAYVALNTIYEKVIANGIKYSSLVEDQVAGLVALRVATTKNFDNQGKALTLQQKYTLAQKESVTTIKQLQAVNQKTPQQLTETIELYKTLVPTLGKTGASQKDLLKVTELLAKASASYGIQFQQLIAGADGLATGTVLANSELGRFLGTIGLNNEALKETNNVTELLVEKLKPLGGELDTLTVANSNLENAWNELTKVITEPLFEPIKDEVKELTSFIEKATLSIQEFFDTFRDASNLQSVEQLNKRVVDIYSEIEAKQKTLSNISYFDRLAGNSEGRLKADIRALKVELLSATNEYNKFVKSQENGSLVTDENIVKITVAHKKLQNETKNTSKSTQQDLMTSASSWQEYYEAIEDYSNAWLFEEAKIRQKFINLDKDAQDKMVAQAKSSYFDKFKTPESAEGDDYLTRQLNALKEYEELAKESAKTIQDYFNFEIEFDTSGLNDLGKSLNTASEILKEMGKEQELYAKAYEAAAGDKEKRNALDEKHLEGQLAGYANLAGTMANSFEEGSKGAEAFMVIQKALAGVAAVQAIITAFTAPFPITFANVATVTAAVGSLLGIIGSSVSSGSTGTSGLAISEQNIDNIEASYDPYINRLDKQIEILEAIELNGSSNLLKIKSSDLSFQKDLGISSQTVLGDSMLRFYENLKVLYPSDFEDIIIGITDVEKELGYTISKVATSVSGALQDSILGVLNPDEIAKLTIDPSKFESVSDIVKFMMELSESGIYDVLGAGDLDARKDSYQSYVNGFNESVTEIMNTISDYAIAIIDVSTDIKDSGDDFKEYFDNITGTIKYEAIKLASAYDDIDNIRGNKSFSAYIEDQINAIDKLYAEFDKETIDLILSSNLEDAIAQSEKIEGLSETIKNAFEGGIEEAQNFADSIELVAEAMEASRKNIDSFVDSFKVDEQLLREQANNLGLSMATTVETLFAQFEQLKNDRLGLTDEELEYLQSAKTYVEELLSNTESLQEEVLQTQLDNYNETLSNMQSNISVVESAMSSLSSVIDKLRESTLGTEYTLNMFYKSMAETRELLNNKDYDNFNDSLSSTINYADALFSASNFKTKADMDFAQLVAANQFKSMDMTLETELSVLQQIEENTSNMINTITDEISLLSNSISNIEISFPSNYLPTGTIPDSWQNANDGTSTWTTPDDEATLVIDNDTLYSDNPTFEDTSVKIANGETYTIDNIRLYVASIIDTLGINKDSITRMRTEAINAGISANSLDTIMGWEIGTSNNAVTQYTNLPAFSEGGYTGGGGKYDVAGLVHKGEYVVNQEQLKNVGGVNAVEAFIQSGNSTSNEIKELIGYTKSLLRENMELTRMFRRVTSAGERMQVDLSA